MASFDEQIRQARREYSLADRAFQELEESSGKDAVQINHLQEDVTRQATALRQTMNRIDGTIRDAPASLRNPQQELLAEQLNEKVIMLEKGLDRFVGRNSSRQRDQMERCAPAVLTFRFLPCTPPCLHVYTQPMTKPRLSERGADWARRLLQGVPIERGSAEGPE